MLQFFYLRSYILQFMIIFSDKVDRGKIKIQILSYFWFLTVIITRSILTVIGTLFLNSTDIMQRPKRRATSMYTMIQNIVTTSQWIHPLDSTKKYQTITKILTDEKYMRRTMVFRTTTTRLRHEMIFYEKHLSFS